jgi:hypothetical protein
LGWLVGTRLRATATAGNFMSGVITSVSTTAVTITVDYTSGSGTFSSWNISIAGEVGATGPNQVTTATDTNITGPLFGNGSKVYLPTAQQAQPYVIPSLTTTQRNALGTPATGYTIFNSTEGYLEYYDSFWGWMPVAGQNEWKSRNGFEYFTDFPQASPPSDYFSVSNSSGGAIDGSTTANGVYPGVLRMSTGGTNAAGNYSAISGQEAFRATAGKTVIEANVNVITLSNSSQEFYVFFGYRNGFTDGCFFFYDRPGTQVAGASASVNWQTATMDNSVRQVKQTTVAVSQSTYVKLRIEINAAGTQVDFYINGTLATSHDQNIPASNRPLQCSVGIVKTVGTTLRSFWVDYFMHKIKYTTAR